MKLAYSSFCFIPITGQSTISSVEGVVLLRLLALHPNSSRRVWGKRRSAHRSRSTIRLSRISMFQPSESASHGFKSGFQFERNGSSQVYSPKAEAFAKMDIDPLKKRDASCRIHPAMTSKISNANNEDPADKGIEAECGRLPNDAAPDHSQSQATERLFNAEQRITKRGWHHNNRAIPIKLHWNRTRRLHPWVVFIKPSRFPASDERHAAPVLSTPAWVETARARWRPHGRSTDPERQQYGRTSQATAGSCCRSRSTVCCAWETAASTASTRANWKISRIWERNLPDTVSGTAAGPSGDMHRRGPRWVR